MSIMMVTCDSLYGVQPQEPYPAAQQKTSRFQFWRGGNRQPAPTPYRTPRLGTERSPEGDEMNLECFCRSKRRDPYGTPYETPPAEEVRR